MVRESRRKSETTTAYNYNFTSTAVSLHSCYIISFIHSTNIDGEPVCAEHLSELGT